MKEMGKHLIHILVQMCQRVGADFDRIDFKKDFWFHEYMWTEEQEESFVDWMTEYLYNNLEARREIMNFYSWKTKKRCRKAAKDFVWYCGWKRTLNGP